MPEHSHAAQWGVILEGRIDLTVEGDTYYIPAGAIHRAKIYAGYKDLTFFNQADRYNKK